MTQTTTETTDVARYAAAVRSALADLCGAQRDELLDDLEGHLAEVAAESPGPLATRLGTPEEYAAELRSSAGLPPPTRRGSLRWRTAPARVTAVLACHPWYRAVRHFIPELRPAWWVARGYLTVLVVSTVFFRGRLAAFPIPSINGRLLGLIALMVAIPASVVLGRRTAAGSDVSRGLRAVVVAGNTVLLLASFVLAVHLHDRFIPTSASAATPSSPEYLSGPSGPISNIYPYSSTGQPLTGVLLYDQDGRPIDNLSPYGNQGDIDSELPLGADGRPITNAYPHRQQVVRYDGISGQPSAAPVLPPRVALPALASPAPTTPSPTPAATPAATPSPSAAVNPSVVQRPGPTG